jgi:predicted signal transduction protein with EAL and GGDEF domain
MGHLITTDASIGIALAPGDGVDLDHLLRNADLALYGAKGDGRRTYRFFETGMDQRAKARRSLELELRQAISDGSLETYYQRVVNIEDGKISSCEALLRWRHRERGMISPAEFIPIAEDSLINQLVGCSIPPAPRPPPGRIMFASRSTFHPCSSGARRWR